MNYRNRKLLDLAHRLHTCQFRLPGCKIYVEHGCEPIHSDHNRHNKGMGIKADDDQHVAGCHHCHIAYTNLPKAEKFDKFCEARKLTFEAYDVLGWLDEVRYKERT